MAQVWTISTATDSNITARKSSRILSELLEGVMSNKCSMWSLPSSVNSVLSTELYSISGLDQHTNYFHESAGMQKNKQKKQQKKTTATMTLQMLHRVFNNFLTNFCFFINNISRFQFRLSLWDQRSRVKTTYPDRRHHPQCTLLYRYRSSFLLRPLCRWQTLNIHR